MGILDYFDIRKSFPFYGAYHHDWRNQIVHCLFVPVIFTTSLRFARGVQLGSTGLSLSDVAASFYALSFMKMDFIAGLLYAPIIAGMHYAGTTALADHLGLAIGLHVAGWIFQFIGHYVEGRKPALLDDLPRALHAAVFFVWLEVLFFLGYKPELKKELERLVVARIKTMDLPKRA